MPNISMKSSNYEKFITLKHSYGVIEVFKLFFPALNRSRRKGKIRVIFRRPFCLWHMSHMLYLRMHLFRFPHPQFWSGYKILQSSPAMTTNHQIPGQGFRNSFFGYGFHSLRYISLVLFVGKMKSNSLSLGLFDISLQSNIKNLIKRALHTSSK